MADQIAVSIICEVYNHEKYVKDALEGFVKQKTTFPFEVLIHDDASTDASTQIIREYEEKYPDIIKPIYQKENQYSKDVWITWEYQAPRVKGKYVAICEGDDYWTDPCKLQKQYDFLEAHPEYSMCACSTAWLNMQTGKVLNLCCTDTDKDVSLEDILEEKRGRVFQLGTVVIRTDCFLSRPEWLFQFGVGDLPLAMHAAISGKVRMLADKMAVYRNQTAGSYTAQLSKDIQFVSSEYNKVVGGLRAFNEATDYVYDKPVSWRVKKMKYNIARGNRDWKTMQSDELREVYKSKRLAARMADMLYCKVPGLYALAMRMLKR